MQHQYCGTLAQARVRACEGRVVGWGVWQNAEGCVSQYDCYRCKNRVGGVWWKCGVCVRGGWVVVEVVGGGGWMSRWVIWVM